VRAPCTRRQAGHCPQDEQPELVNKALLEWMESDLASAAGSSGGAGPQVAATAVAAGGGS
jgi:hypothetical protein